MTTAHALACNTQALASHHEGTDISSLHASGPGIKAEITTPLPFSRALTAAANFPDSNTGFITSHTSQTGQTSFEEITTVTSQDLNTGPWGCVNSGRSKDCNCNYLPMTSKKRIGNTGANGALHHQVSLQRVCHSLSKHTRLAGHEGL